MATQDTSIRASCHCGAVTVTVPGLPKYINICQCTICRRYGAGWGYYKPDDVKIETKPDESVVRKYTWGDKDLSFNFCGECGVQCYWWPLRPSPSTGEWKMGLNMNLVNPELLKFVDRKYEYSTLKQPVRSKDYAHPDDPATYT